MDTTMFLDVVRAFLLFALGAGSAIGSIALLWNLIYNAYFHPLRHFPGPKLWAASRLPWSTANINGQIAVTIKNLHIKYGPVVRIGPDELSYVTTTGEEWKAIYARKPYEMPKDLNGHGFPPPGNGIHGIISADQENHARQRRAVAPAFSDKALREQEPFFHQYISKFLALVRKGINQEQDLAMMLNWTTFDIIGDLTIGKSFAMLDNAATHPWVGMIIGNIKAITVVQLALYYRLTGLLKYVVSSRAYAERSKYMNYSYARFDERLARGGDPNRKDLLQYISENADPANPIYKAELHSTSANFMIAGSETSATTLAGMTYFCLSDEKVYEKLCAEIRQAFNSEEEINMVNVAKLKYLSMAIQETWRLYPPVPNVLPRVVPSPGERMNGQWVPGDTVIGIHPLATNHSPLNFHAPDTFDPSRWDEPGIRPHVYDDDNREAIRPFSYGPRDCIGQSLAHAEIRLIFCRMIWNFDLEMTESAKAGWGSWEKQGSYLVWEKRPLMVRFRERMKKVASDDDIREKDVLVR